MADALVERRPTARYFCHRCNTEFEDVLQDYTCPYCASGFIEQLEETEGPLDEFSDADMSNLDDLTTIDEPLSNLDDSDEMPQSTPPMLNDLAFLMSGGRVRGAGRRETLMEQLVWMIGGGRGGIVTAGAPFVLVGAPGDYVFGGEGLDAVVTQLLGQLENTGPPPLTQDQINAIPEHLVTDEQAANNATCSVCWEPFTQGEPVSRLECEHIFHAACIGPWLQLHATCPICRRSLLPEEAAPVDPAPSRDADNDTGSTPNSAESSTTSLPRVVLRRMTVRRTPRRTAGGREVGESSSSSSMELGSSAAEWAEPSSATPSSSSISTRTTPRTPHTPRTPASAYNMDIEFD